MLRNNKFKNRRETVQSVISCDCGGKSKLSSRKNFPFGRKSKCTVTKSYRCSSCDKVIFLHKTHGGKR